jgi:hypothetical protein
LEKCLKHTETFENKHFKKKTLNVKLYKKRRTIQNEPLKTGCIQRKSVKKCIKVENCSPLPQKLRTLTCMNEQLSIGEQKN